jgi:hypothetical protein
MSNKCIYPNNYVYLIEHITSGKYYIGSRSTNLLPEDDIGKKYFSSSRDKNFIKDQKANKDMYKYTVLKNFDNREDANLYETELHHERQVHLDPNSYNMAMNSSKGFSTVGKTPAKDQFGNIILVSVDDPRLETSELVYVTTGLITVYDKEDKRHIIDESDYDPNIFLRLGRYEKKCKDTDGNIFTLHFGNSRIKNSEVKVAEPATDDSDTYLVFSDDPRILNGSLKFVNKKKKIFVYDKNDMRHNINEDDYDPNIFYKLEYNHKKCKDANGNIFSLYMTNSRVKNGEVQVAKLETDGKDTYLVFPDDPRILNGSLKFTRKKTNIFVYGIDNKRHIICDDDYDSNSDEFYRIPTDYKKCKDVNGNIFFLYYRHKKIKNGEVLVAEPAVSGKDIYLVFPDDPRILNGSLKYVEKKKNKKMIYAYDNNDKRHIINEDDYNSDEFFRLPSHHKKCKDIDGNIIFLQKNHKRIKDGEVLVARTAISDKDTYLVFEDDPRILNGSLNFKLKK